MLTGEDKHMGGQTDEQNSAMVFTRESAHSGGGGPISFSNSTEGVSEMLHWPGYTLII